MNNRTYTFNDKLKKTKNINYIISNRREEKNYSEILEMLNVTNEQNVLMIYTYISKLNTLGENYKDC